MRTRKAALDAGGNKLPRSKEEGDHQGQARRQPKHLKTMQLKSPCEREADAVG
jgi:hypothetical protein